jgi:internalin A
LGTRGLDHSRSAATVSLSRFVGPRMFESVATLHQTDFLFSFLIFVSIQGLKRLNMAGNQLSEVSSCIGNIRNLTHLDLSRNLITQVPHEISLLANLQQLILAQNQIRAFNILFDFDNLTILDLSSNKINENVSMWNFKRLRSVERVDLHSNALTGSLSISIFDEMKNVTKIDVSMNHIEGPLPSLIGCSNLISLFFGYNKVRVHSSIIAMHTFCY